MRMLTALITGITGQDGSYLAEFLLEKGYRVCGIVRRSATPNLENIEHILDKIELYDGDLLDLSSLSRIIRKVGPHEVYNLAAQSFVGSSWDMPLYIGDVTGLGAARMLEAIRSSEMYSNDIKFYQASSSEMFGSSPAPQDELTPFHPRSPYGVAKVYAHLITQNYRESYGMYACSGILFNHESPRRGHEFVTRKIAKGVADISDWLEHETMNHASGVPVPKIKLGNLYAKRDWGHAKDYVRAMWLMMNHREPLDLVIGTGIEHSVMDFVVAAFEAVGIEDCRGYIEVDDNLRRPAEVERLLADYDAAKQELGWNPLISFDSLVGEMVRSEIDRLNV